MNSEQEYEKNKELSDRTIDAILIGFKRNLCGDYKIPPDLQASLNSVYLQLRKKFKLEKRINEGICNLLFSYEGDFILEGFHNEFYKIYPTGPGKYECYGKPRLGTFYKFKKGEYKNANFRAKEYFTKDEMLDFYIIHKMLNKQVREEIKERIKNYDPSQEIDHTRA